MRPGRGGLHWTRWQALGAVALVAVTAALLWQRAAFAPTSLWLARDAEAPWIAAPRPVEATFRQDADVVRFVRRFAVTRAAPDARLRLRALRAAEVALDGRVVAALDGGALAAPDGDTLAAPDGRALALPDRATRAGAVPPDGATRAGAAPPWRAERSLPLAGALAPGTHELRVTVRNPRGPALLSLRSEGVEPPLATGEGWQVETPGAAAARGGAVAAVLADDTRPHPALRAGPGAAASLAGQATLLAGLFAAGAVATLAFRRQAPPALRRRLPALGLALALAGFAASLAAVYGRIPVRSGFGFDLGNHLAYVELVRGEGRLPLATEGWSTYHPPLFYAASAALAALFERATALDPASALRVLPFAAGLALVWIAFALARALLPRRPAAAAVAALFAGALPLNLTLAAYPSNEGPHAALAAAAVLATVRALLAPAVTARAAVAIGLLLGLALLTKFTALLLLPPVAFFLAAKLWILERARVARIAGRLGAVAASALVVCGAWYGRNVLHYGRPIVGNWDLPEGGLVWWQHPGFHTAAYYTGFGAVLERPLFSGFASFWDSLYSTFWLDGYLGGRASVVLRRPAFDYELMAALALLALPATALLGLGAVRALVRAFRAPGGRERAAWSFLLVVLWALGFAMVAVTFELPYYAQARASYGLLGVPLLALLFALALTPPRDRATLPGGDVTVAVAGGYLALLFAASWLTLLAG